MKKIVYFLIISITLMACHLSLPLGLSKLFKKPQTFIYVEVDRDNQPTGDLIISDIEGNEINSFSMPDVDGKQRISFIPVRASGIELIYRFSDDEGMEYFWLDVNHEELQKLRLDRGFIPHINPLTSFYQYGWEHYGIFTDSLMDEKFLIDLETGKLEELTNFFQEETALFDKFSSDESYMVFNGFSNTWILSTEGPEITREFGGESDIYDIHFSPDNKMIAYVSETEGEYKIITEIITNYEKQILMRSNDFVHVLGFIDDDSILISNEEESFIINLNSGEEEMSLEHGGDSELLQLSASEDKVFVSIGDFNEPPYYYWIDLKSMEAEELIDLESMRIKSNSESCVLLEDSFAPIKIESVNMDTGQITNIDFDLSTPNYTIRTYLSNDANSVLLIPTEGIANDSISAGYAFNCVTGEVFEMGSGRISLGAVSPNNDYAIYGFQSEGDDYSEIILLNLDTGVTSELGRGLSPTWILP